MKAIKYSIQIAVLLVCVMGTKAFAESSELGQELASAHQTEDLSVAVSDAWAEQKAIERQNRIDRQEAEQADGEEAYLIVELN